KTPGKNQSGVRAKLVGIDWRMKEDFSMVPAQMMRWVRECADALILMDELDEDGDIQVKFNRIMCDSDQFPEIAHQEGNPFDLAAKNSALWINPRKPYSFFLPCTMVKPDTEISVRGDWNCKICNKGIPCRPAIAAYYKYLQTYHPGEFLRQRQEYFKNKDSVDGILNKKRPLPDLEYTASELPAMPSKTIDEIRQKIDDYAYDIGYSQDTNYPLMISDYTNTRLTSGRTENWSNQALNAFISNSRENSVAQKYSPADTEKMRYLMILKLLETPEEYAAYVNRIKASEAAAPELQGGSYYGFVAGNDRQEVAETVKSVAENIQLRFGISNTYSKFTAMDLMQNLATVDSHPRYMPMNYTHLQDDTVYLITGLSEFTKAYRSATNDFGEPSRRQAEHFIKEISEFRLHRFILLAGTESDIKDFLDLSPSLQIFFNNNKVIIRDKTIDEIYDIFRDLVDGRLPSPLPEDAREQFKEYFTFNVGAFPFKNRSLSEYIANYMIQNNSFCFPQDLSGIKRKNFMEELDQLIGLENIKTSVKRLYDFARYRQAAQDNGITLKASNMHMVFTGNPGTGKTTVARLIARALYDVGVLKENKLVECEKKDLIGEYLGQTAPKTYSMIEKALGGVLFIDEAYSLAPGSKGDSYSEEAVATLVKAMEDKRDNLVIIFAGYKAEMARFIASNPGIASRVGYTFHFEDYTEDELADMFFLKMRQSKLNVNESCRPKIKSIMQYFHNVENLGNGRFVDKLYQLTLQKRSTLADPELSNIDENSIPEINEIIEFLPNNELMILPGSVKDAEKRRVAIHESGHAFIGRLLNAGDDIERITVETSAGGVLGYVQHKPRAQYLRISSDYEDSICVLLAGLAAEEVFLGSYSDGGSSDLTSAMELASRMVEDNGMSPLGFAARYLKERNKDSKELFDAVDTIVRGQFARTKLLLSEHSASVLKLADTLEEKGTIDKGSISALFGSLALDSAGDNT
ncbi:MAG: AAA family ATPase, partial [Clostridia bacterium]|nr:AAA family ATPase [Clostridia bacterium]